MKKRGHTRDCLDAAEAYLPCICGVDEHNRKVDAMTQPTASEGLPPFDQYKNAFEPDPAERAPLHGEIISTNFGTRPDAEGPLAKVAFGYLQTSIDHGFWPEAETLDRGAEPLFATRNFGEMIALAHSELSEALDEHRSGLPFVYENTQPGKEGKPEGIAVELADCVIRVFDTLASMADDHGLIDGYTIDELFELKAEYNKGREHKHGRAY